MTPEAPQGEPDKRYDIRLGVPFKPFENAHTFFWPKKGEEPFCVHEDYDYELALRREVSFMGVEGYIDVISENLRSSVAMLVSGLPLEKPLGEVIYRFTLREEGGTINELPYILRFAFHLKKPADYAKLLNSFADVNIGNDKYLLVWNFNRNFVKQNIQELEKGHTFVVIENNLFNQKLIDDVPHDIPPGDADEEDMGCVTHVWLPRKLKPLKGISMTFGQFGDNDDDLTLSELPPPDPRLFAIASR